MLPDASALRERLSWPVGGGIEGWSGARAERRSDKQLSDAATNRAPETNERNESGWNKTICAHFAGVTESLGLIMILNRLVCVVDSLAFR